jgi:hypothetical protein
LLAGHNIIEHIPDTCAVGSRLYQETVPVYNEEMDTWANLIAFWRPQMVTFTLPAELEKAVTEEAAKTGIDAGTFVVRTLEERLRHNTPQRMPSHLYQEEAFLLQRINQVLSEATWQEYHHLIAKRRAETLMQEEHERLIALSDGIEAAHTERIAHVAELAQLRQTPLKTLMAQLGIKPRKV